MKKSVYAFILLIMLSTASFSALAGSLQPQIINDGVLLSTFDTVSDWTGNVSADTTNFVEGTSAVKLTSTSGSVYMTSHIKDVSSASEFSFWLYVYSLSNFDTVQLHFSSTSTFSKYFRVVIGPSQVVPGWNHITVSKEKFTNYYAESWSTVQYARFRMTVRAPMSCSFDNFTYDMQARAKIIFTFDDNFNCAYTIVKPILDSNNQRAVAFIVSNYVGNSGRLTLSQINALYDSGWDISSHSMDHRDMNTLSTSELDKQINGSFNWLIDKGFNRSAAFFAYPYGSGFDNPTVIAKLKEHYTLARSVKWDDFQAPISELQGDSLYALKAYNVYNTQSIETLKAVVDNTINRRGTTILTLHVISETAPTKLTMTTANFKALSDYIASRSADIDVVTFSDLYKTEPPVEEPVPELEEYSMTVSASKGGSYTVSANETSVTISIIPKDGYNLYSLLVDGVNVGNYTTFTISNSATLKHTASITFIKFR